MGERKASVQEELHRVRMLLLEKFDVDVIVLDRMDIKHMKSLALLVVPTVLELVNRFNYNAILIKTIIVSIIKSYQIPFIH